MKATQFIMNPFLRFALLAMLGACASSGGDDGGDLSMGGGTDELESLAASIDSSAGESSGPSESDMQISENDLLSGDLAAGEKSSGDELSLDDSQVAESEDLSLDDTLAADERGVAVSSGGGGATLAITASGSVSMALMDTGWLDEATESSLGFSCHWKTLKDSGKVRHRICSIEKQVVVNVLEKNRGGGFQLAKMLFDQRGKAAFNRWKKSLKAANFIYHKDRRFGSGKTASRYMSPDHRSHVDLVWNDSAGAATLIMIPTAKGLGRELKKVAGF